MRFANKGPAGFQRAFDAGLDVALQFEEAGLAGEAAAGLLLDRPEAETDMAPHAGMAQEAVPALARLRARPPMKRVTRGSAHIAT